MTAVARLLAARWARNAPPRRQLLVPLFVLSLLFLFFFRLGHRELYSSHEARAAQNAQRMLDTGEWGLPVLFDGQADLQKPPGYYWLVAFAGWLNGGTVTAFEARLPAALAGLITVLMVFGWLRSEGRPTAAWIAATALATAIHFTAITRTARIDVPLTCAVTTALLSFGRGESLWRWAAAGFFAALGVLLKGPIAVVLIGPVALLSLWLRGKPTDGRLWALWGKGALLGTGVVALVSAPWFLWANSATHGEFFQVFFVHHNLERFAGTSPTLASHPWWYYAPRFAADFLPWTPAFLALVVLKLRAGSVNDGPLRFGLIWFAAMFLVLSTAHFKRADYLLPLYPGAAIALGCAAESWLATRTGRWLFALGIVASVAVWLVSLFIVEPAEQAKEDKRGLAAIVREQAPEQEVMLFRCESHLLAFHLGRPLITRVEWHDLNDWLATPGPHVVVMPPEYVYPAQQIVRSRRLVEVARLEQFTGSPPARPLVCLRTE
jgi:4-amino-4-deoxy-L-arabinose transferase-like glycosyltransferase